MDQRGRARAGEVFGGVCLAAALYCAGYLVREAFGGSMAPPFWPNAGIAFASMILLGPSYWPAVFVAELALALPALPLGTAVALAAASAGAQATGAGLALRWGGGRFTAPADVRGYFAGGAIAATIEAPMAALIFLATNSQPTLIGTVTWWLANFTGTVVVGPLVLLWARHPLPTGRWRDAAEMAAITAVSTAMIWVIFSGRTTLSLMHAPLSFVLLPAALWAGVRLGLREAATILAAIAAGALVGTLRGYGPFAASAADGVTILQTFMVVKSVVALSVSAAIWRARDDRLALARAREELRLVVDAAPGMIAYINPDLTYRYVNRRFHSLWPHARHFAGRRVSDVADRRVFEAAKPRLEEALAGREAEFDWEANGRWYHSSYTPDRAADGTVRGVIALITDVTESKRVNAELERRVELRTQRLRQVNEELESFAYAVAHDLRSPLRKMSGFSEIVLQEYSDKLPSEGSGYLKRIFDASRRMGRLIDEMLELSTVTRRETKEETVDLSRLARVIVDELANADPDRRIEATIAPGLSAVGDPGLLEAALRNLLDNAWKFTAGRRPARVEVGMIPQEPSPIFFVRDNGVGFEMAHARKLFKAFERLHEEFPGTGIGLATVQRVMQRHGGRVWAEGKSGEGATFYFTLHERQR